MQFSVVTPSRNQLEWLRLCAASVADQGVAVEHLVQDAASTDGTREWLAGESRVLPVSEPDNGMYDAINRGLRRSRGEVLSYLNCDEQYLPGALASVGDYFEQHPGVDVVFGYVVVVDERGEFVCYRKTLTPALRHTQVAHLATWTAATFFRRRVLEAGHWFNPEYRCAGDAEWMIRLLRAGVRMAALPRYTSAFTLTGGNQTRSDRARAEARQLARQAPLAARLMKPLLVLHHRWRRWRGGIYAQPPFNYAIHAGERPSARVEHHVARPRFRLRWPD